MHIGLAYEASTVGVPDYSKRGKSLSRVITAGVKVNIVFSHDWVESHLSSVETKVKAAKSVSRR